MATIKIGDADNIKLGSQNVLRVMFNGEQVWPLSVSWVIVQNTIAVHYLNAQGETIDAIRAAGESTSYAYVTADVDELHGPNVHHRISNATLTPQPFSNSLFYIDSNHSTWIRSHSLGTNPDYQQTGPSLAVNFKYNTSYPVSATIQQQTNTKTAQGTTDVTTGFSFGVDREWLYHSGGTINLTNTIQSYQVSTHYIWTSTAESDELDPTVNTRTHAPDAVNVSPTPQSIAQDFMSVTFAANNTSQDKPYIIEASLDGKQGGTQTINVRAAIYNYSHLVITSYTYNEIPASGSRYGIYPNPIAIEMDCSIDNGSPFTLSGTARNGASSATLSGSGHSVTVAVGYQRREGSTWRIDGDNGLVTASSRGYTEDSSHTTDTVNYPYRSVQATFGSIESDWYSTTVYQQRNQKSLVSSTLSSYDIELDTDNISFSQTTVTITRGTAYYADVYSWTSEEPNTTTYRSIRAFPTSIWTDPSVPSGNINLTNHTVTIPANSSSTGRSYVIYGRYNDGSSYKDGEADLWQAGLSHSFANPVVTNFAYAKIDGGESYNVPASGNKRNPIYPSFHVAQTFGNGSSTSGAGTIEFNVSNGTTNGTITYQGVTYSYSVQYYINNSYASSAGVEIDSRGTYDDGSDADVTVRSNCYAVVTMNSKSGTSNTASIKQQANRGTPYSAYDSYSTVYINRLLVNGSEIGAILYDAKDTTVTAEVKATWEHFFAGVVYTSGESTGGGSEYHDEVITPYYLDVTGGSGGYGVTAFTASNKHSESNKSYSVMAQYQQLWSSAVGFTQMRDTKVSSGAQNYTATLDIENNIWAGGGTATLVAYATHETWMKWSSDQAIVDGSLETIYDNASVSLEDGTTLGRMHLGSRSYKTDGSGHKYSQYIVTHDDMKKVAATDALVVKAYNDSHSSTSSTEIRRTVTNQLETGWPRSYGAWSIGPTDTVYSEYGIKTFTIDDYNTAAFPASFKGAEAGYTVVGRHYETRQHTDSRDEYTRYSSWSSEHDDNDHRTKTGTDTRTVVISGPTEVTGDTVNLTTTASWVTINTSQSKLVLDAQGSTGRARYATIRATNAGGGATITADVYQAGYANLSSNKSSINFPAAGGTNTFIVTAKYTTWTIDYPRAVFGQNPDLTLKVNGSDANHQTYGDIETSSAVTTVTVICGANDLSTMLAGTITLTPNAPGTSSSDIVRVTIGQAAQS